MFEHNEVQQRDQTLQESMPFLYTLIQSIFTHHQADQMRAGQLRKSRRQQRKKMIEQDQHAEPACLPWNDCEGSENTDESYRLNASSNSSYDPHATHPDIQSDDSEDDSLDDLSSTHLDDPEEFDLGTSTLSKDNEYIRSWNGDVYHKSRDQAKNLKRRSASVSLEYVSDK